MTTRKRKKLLGLNIKTLDQGKSVQCQLQCYGVHTLKNPIDDKKEIEYAEFCELDTGETFQMWLNAGLKQSLTLVKADTPIELVYMGKTEFTDKQTGKSQMVNQYTIYELENDN